MHHLKKLFLFGLLIIFFAQHSKAQCIHSVSTTNIEIPALGGNAYVYLTTEECENYSAYTSDTWYYLWVDYYDQVVTAYADANYEGSRYGTIIIDDYETENDITISVYQEYGCQQLPSPGNITGYSSVCYGASATYSINPIEGASSYHWSVNGNTLSQYGTSATITFSGYSEPITITACGYNECQDGVLSSKQITLLYAANISSHPSSIQVCEGSSATFSTSAQNATSFQWQDNSSGTFQNIPGATGASYAIQSATSGMNGRQFRCLVTNSCSSIYSNAATLTVNYVSASGSISGTSSVCPGQNGFSYSVAAISNATGYQWTLPDGATIASGNNTNSITVNYSTSAVSGNITVRGYNSCNYGAYSPAYYVSVNSINQPGAVNGPSSVCAGSTYNYYVNSVPGAASYTWSLPSGASGSSSSNSINVTFGTNGGNVSVYATNSAGCSSPTSSTTVYISTAYSGYSVTGGGYICPGGSTAVGLSGSAGDITYKCYLNGVFQSPAVSGTGGAISFGNKTQAGTYTIKGITSAGCEFQMSGSAVINYYTESSPASYISNSSPVVCPGGASTLTAVGGNLGSGANWYWYANDCNSTPVFIGNPYTPQVNSTTTYYVKAVGYCSPTACVSTTVNVSVPPAITQHPGNVTVCDGASASFNITASNASYYQWQVNSTGSWTNIGGATGSTYYIPSTAGMNGWSYRCLAYGSCSWMATSNAATISISTLTVYPVQGTMAICPGSSTEVFINSSELNRTYSIFRDGTFLSSKSGTGSILEWTGINVPGTYTIKGYSAIGCEIPMSGSAVITLRTPSIQPTSISVTPGSVLCPGSSATLTIVGGTLEPGYGVWKWYSGACGSVLSGQGSTSINVSPSASTTYFARAEGGCVTTSCASISLTVKASIAITSQPANASVIQDETANFSISATGPNLQYAWEYSVLENGPWTALSAPIATGFNSPNLSINTSGLSDINVRCKLTSDCEQQTSNSAHLAINYPVAEYLTGGNVIEASTRNLNDSLVVGTTAGKISIDSHGASNYNIPVFVSPGTAGMQPGISIAYNSALPNGIMGRGWDIEGLSSIHRVARDFYHDGKLEEVNLTSNDRFALDSNRLVINTGVYGNDLSTYKTELETFVRVTAHGSAGTGPQWFEVQTKDGKTIEYGRTDDSRVETYGSSTVRLWRINKITDQFSNYILFTYYEHNGESYIKKIEYTGNENASLQPYNSLTFDYIDRTDINSSYIAGYKVPERKLLTLITITNENNVVRKYEFKYTLDFYTHLNQIIEKGSDNRSYNPVIIDWGEEEEPMTSPADISGLPHSSTSYFYPGDFNGDGRTDYLVTPRKTSYSSSDQWKIFLASGDGLTFTQQGSGNLSSIFQKFIVSDINGDGKSDVYWKTVQKTIFQCNPHPCGEQMLINNVSTSDSVQNSLAIIDSLPAVKEDSVSIASTDIIMNQPPETCYDECTEYDISFLYYYFDGTSLVRGSTLKDHVYTNYATDLDLFTADLNGDALMDEMILEPGNTVYQFSISDSTYSGNSLQLYKFYFIDFDGDRKEEMLNISSSGSTILQYNPTSHTFETVYSSSTFPVYTDQLFPGDYNGDGKTDILYWNNGWHLNFSTGTGFISSSNVPLLTNVNPGTYSSDNNIYIEDFNGDGKDDVLEAFLSAPASTIKVFYSRGDGFFAIDNNAYSKTSIQDDYLSFGDFNGDGKKDLAYYDYSTGSNYLSISFFRKDEKKHLVSCIANGLNYKTWVNYSRLNADTAFYKKSSGAAFPVIDYNGSYTVVESTSELGEYGLGLLSTLYTYEGLRKHLQGKGMLGFQAMTNGDNGMDSIFVRHEYSYDTSYYYSYPSKSSTWLKYEDYKLNEVINAYSTKAFSNQVFFPVLTQSESKDFEKNQSRLSFYDYDDYGNMLSDSTRYLAGTTCEGTKTTKNSYQSYGNYGIPNKLTSTTYSAKYGAEARYFRKTSYNYDTYGKLLTEITDPNTTNQVTRTYSYSNNVFGLPSGLTVSATGVTSRDNTFGYDSKGRFVIATRNAISHTISRTFNTGTGNVLTESGVDGNTTTYEYDGFGRQTRITTPTGVKIYSAVLWDTLSLGGENSVYLVRTSSPSRGRADETVYYDNSGRKLMVQKDGFGSNTIYQMWNYSLGGSLTGMTYPYYQGDSIKTISYRHDAIGRLLEETDYGLTTSYSYNGNDVTVYNPASQRKTTRTNSLNLVTQVTENNNNTISYSYFSNGQPKSISTAGTTVTFGYDNFGRRTSVTDPNSGTKTFQSNAYGELVSQTDAKSNTYSFEYDNLGRLNKKQVDQESTIYYYVETGPGKEQVDSIIGPGGVTHRYIYDKYGRVIKIRRRIGNDAFETSYQYDSLSNNISIRYPSGIEITNEYDDDGYMTAIKRGNTQIWSLTAVKANGQPLAYSNATIPTTFVYDNYNYLASKSFGSHSQVYNFNQNTGNLTNRTLQGHTENFLYDNMDRLTSWNYSSGASYDPNGNISTKTDAGTYEYDESRVNAVTSITDNPGTIPTIHDQVITYTPFDMVETISDTINNIPYTNQYTYGPDNMRIKSEMKSGGNVIKTKYYTSNYEKVIENNTTRHLNYIYSPYGLVALIDSRAQAETLYYVETDHLGSIISLYNTSNSSYLQYSYDAWGRRRNPITWSYDDIPASSITDRGFTGHEHLDEFGLINMNGRMYDPVLGRFLSVDPIIQFADNSQSFNGYSYCLNNPLRYFDPSGYIVHPGGQTDSGGGSNYQPVGNPLDDPWLNPQHFSLEELLYRNNYNLLETIKQSSNFGGGTNNHDRLKFDGKNWILNGVVIPPSLVEKIKSRAAGQGGRPGFNIDNAVSTLNENALSSSSGYCAKYVRYALEAGGINTNGRPGSAKDYDSFLLKKGFNEVTSNNYKPIKGDIAVMEAFTGVKSHPHGHIQMYNGTQWISDFRQNSFWPGSDYRNFTPSLTILRW